MWERYDTTWTDYFEKSLFIWHKRWLQLGSCLPFSRWFEVGEAQLDRADITHFCSPISLATFEKNMQMTDVEFFAQLNLLKPNPHNPEEAEAAEFLNVQALIIKDVIMDFNCWMFRPKYLM